MDYPVLTGCGLTRSDAAKVLPLVLLVCQRGCKRSANPLQGCLGSTPSTFCHSSKPFTTPSFYPPFLLYLNPLNHCYWKLLTQDLTPVLHHTSTKYLPRCWPNNISSGSRSRNSTLGIRLTAHAKRTKE